jgi:hypothetical protein
MEEIFAEPLIGNHSSQYPFHAALTHESTFPPDGPAARCTLSTFLFPWDAEREPTQSMLRNMLKVFDLAELYEDRYSICV